MIPEKRFLNQIQQVLARLMQPLWLLDTEGTVLLPEENRSKINLPEFMEPGMPVAFEGKTFLMIGITPELILCADAQGAATHDCIVLAGAMVQSMGRGEAPIQSRYDVYRRVLREELAGSELEALAHEHQIEMNRERCVLTFQILQTETETAFNMLEELVPRAGGDLLIFRVKWARAITAFCLTARPRACSTTKCCTPLRCSSRRISTCPIPRVSSISTATRWCIASTRCSARPVWICASLTTL